MKPNEILGLLGAFGMVSVLAEGITGSFSVLHLFGIAFFGFIQLAGFSLWGLWTFNPWVKKLLENKPE